MKTARDEIKQMSPIGIIHTPFKEASGTPIQGALSGGVQGEIILDPAYREGIDDLDGFSHIVLIYVFNQLIESKLKIIPYLDKRERGVFATRSPCRPNPIGLTVVRLLEIDGLRLKIEGVDMLDGTQLLDIKPSIPMFDYKGEDGRYGWFEPYLREIKEKQAVPVADDRFHRQGGKEI